MTANPKESVPDIAPATRELISLGERYYVPNYKPRAMILDHGKGARIWDKDGNEYLDLGCGIAVSSLGHQEPDLVDALVSQAKKLWHTSNVYYTEPPVRLAEELVEASGWASRVYFCNSGTEANEAAIKLVRKTASKKYPPTKREIITFHGSFHGRTLAAVTATAQPKYQEGYEPLPGGFTYAPYNDFEAMEKLITTEKTCAVMVEPVQGEGGIVPAKPGFLAHLRKLCDKHDALLVYDEIQCGMGRTGTLFGFQHEKDCVPDVLTLAKALGCGVPIGAMLVGKKAEDTFQFGSHGSTFGGNPIMCAVARVALRKLNSPQIRANVEKQAKKLREALEKIGKEHDLFEEVRGRGLMIGAALKQPWHGKAGDIGETCRQHGVLILQAGPNVLRFLPPLNITDEELAAGIERVASGIKAHLAQAK